MSSVNHVIAKLLIKLLFPIALAHFRKTNPFFWQPFTQLSDLYTRLEFNLRFSFINYFFFFFLVTLIFFTSLFLVLLLCSIPSLILPSFWLHLLLLQSLEITQDQFYGTYPFTWVMCFKLCSYIFGNLNLSISVVISKAFTLKKQK